MKTVIIYTLLTVTYSGEVHHDTGYRSLHSCQEALSVATIGRTIEQKTADDEEERKKYEQDNFLKQQFKNSHPPHDPKTKYEKEVLSVSGNDYDDQIKAWDDRPKDDHECFEITPDKKIQEEICNHNQGTWTWGDSKPQGVKTAECVIETK